MDLRIEIAGDKVTCLQDGRQAYSGPLPEFLTALVARATLDALPGGEAIPESVRFVWRRGSSVVLAMEQPPLLHSVRWLADESKVQFGKGATYRAAHLAFPFVVLVIAFRDGELTGQQQCFYRSAPLAGLEDLLYLPNLYNVANAYGQACWLCLANLKTPLASLSWTEKVRTIWIHLFGAGFNASSEVHEGMSYWGAMRKIDPRVATLSAWEEASRKDPLFPLRVPWRAVGKTLGQVMEEMLSAVAPPRFPATAVGLMQVLNEARAPAAPRRSWLRR